MLKNSFLIRGLEFRKIIPFPVWVIPFPVGKLILRSLEAPYQDGQNINLCIGDKSRYALLFMALQYCCQSFPNRFIYNLLQMQAKLCY